jgi:DNA-binding LacI/PurR family transcriptional regulator
MARPKLVQIAQMANTTPSTISKVINGRPGVSQETRNRIDALLSRINYSKRPVRHPRSHTIMIVCRDLSQPWVPDLLKGAFRYASEHGMVVSITGRDIGNDVYIRAIERAHPVAVLFDNPYIPMEDRRVCDRLNIVYSVLSLDGRPAQESTEYRIDDWRTGFVAGQYLLHLGHRRIAVVCGPLTVPCNSARLDGFRAALRQEHCRLPQRWVSDTPGWMESGRTAALAFLSDPAPLRPTAIFSTSDTIALGVLVAAQQRGVAVPNELSILGCDGIEAGKHAEPPLTTFCHPVARMVDEAFEQMGRQSVEENVSSSRAPSIFTYQTHMVERGSCASPPSHKSEIA